MRTGQQKDLIVLVADKNMQFSLRGILANPLRLGIRQITTEVIPHPKHDAAVFRECHMFLRPLQRLGSYALVVFDRDGCGRQKDAREALEAEVEARLAANGWADRSAAVAIDPELESWFWSDSPHVDAILGWPSAEPTLRSWLVVEGYFGAKATKANTPQGSG